MKNYNKILGSILGAAIGDAMGAAPASRTTELIKKDFGNGNFIFDYKDLRHDCVAFDMPRGAVTEGFSGAYVFANDICKNEGIISEGICKKALFDWIEGNYKEYYEKYAGPTTRKGVAILEKQYKGDAGRDHLLFECRTATSGAAMRAWISGLFNCDNMEKSIEDALTIGYTTHDNPISLSAGACVAAAITAAHSDKVTLSDIIDQAEYGLKLAYSKAKEFCRPSAGASIERRFNIAVETGIKYTCDFEKCIYEMNNKVGLGELASESIPAAFGFLTAAKGKVMDTIYLAINAGNNCDTIAMLGAAVAGAFCGASSIPEGHLDFLSEVNKMDIKGLADRIVEV